MVKNCKIKIMKDGPYAVSGSVPLEEKVIVYKDYENHYVGGQPLPQMETYALCRCGHSKNLPFCDGSHSKVHFDGTETASKEPYLNQAESVEDPDLMLTDVEDSCAFARFCHKKYGDVWNLTEESGNSKCHAKKVMNALWGMGQMMYTKMIIVVDENVDPQDVSKVAWKVFNNIDAKRDLVISEGPLDALDHSSDLPFYGGRLGIDATVKWPSEGHNREWPSDVEMSEEMKRYVDKRWSEYGID